MSAAGTSSTAHGSAGTPGAAADGGAGAATRTGLGSIDAERFDAATAVGGWRGMAESVLPTLVFVLIMAIRPTALVTAVAASLTLSALAMVARLVQRQQLTQVLGGAAVALISAVSIYTTGFVAAEVVPPVGGAPERPIDLSTASAALSPNDAQVLRPLVEDVVAGRCDLRVQFAQGLEAILRGWS